MITHNKYSKNSSHQLIILLLYWIIKKRLKIMIYVLTSFIYSLQFPFNITLYTSIILNRTADFMRFWRLMGDLLFWIVHGVLYFFFILLDMPDLVECRHTFKIKLSRPKTKANIKFLYGNQFNVLVNALKLLVQ